jgi:alkyl hydroperoxide reductase subunit AhpF
MEKLLNEDVSNQVKDVLSEMMQYPVKVLFFSGKENCEYCDQTRQLLEEIVSLNAGLNLENFDIVLDAEAATKHNVSEVPAIVIAGLENEQLIDYGIRFLGIPAGHEFTSLINSIIMVSRREAGLNPSTKEFLAKLDKEILLRVFVTPT